MVGITPEDAEEYTQALGQIVAGGWRQIAWAQRQGIPAALGLSTEQWVEQRLGGYVRQSIPERREAVRELMDGGLSTREAAAVLGVDNVTVWKDRKAVENATRLVPPDHEEAVSGVENATLRRGKSHREAHAERLDAYRAAAEEAGERRQAMGIAEPRYDVIVRDDALTYLRDLPEGCAQMCVTSPPYWAQREYTGDARELGRERRPSDYIARLVEVVNEIGRVLAEGGYLFLNLGDTYASQPGQYRGDPARVRGISSRLVQGAGTAMGERDFEGIPPKSLCAIPDRVAIALADQHGWRCASRICWVKENAPPENVYDRVYRNWEPIYMLTRSEHAYFDKEALRQLAPGAERDIWFIPVGQHGKAQGHYAPFPESLVERTIVAACPPGGVVLDPFAGSGTTLRVARRMGRRFLGCDLAPPPTLEADTTRSVPEGVPLPLEEPEGAAAGG